MNVLIVERKKEEALKLVQALHLADPSITIVETVHSLTELQTWIQKNPWPDIVLIDHSKLGVLSELNTDVLAKLVLHTKHHSLTYLAFRAHTLHRLTTKPSLPVPGTKGFQLDTKLISATTAGEDQGNSHPLFKNRFFVESGNRFISIPVSQIAYFFSDARFVYFITHSKNKYIIHYKLDELEQLLNPEDFYRINRSYIISIASIDQILPYFAGRFRLQFKPPVEEKILVSRNRAPGFRKWLGE